MPYTQTVFALDGAAVPTQEPTFPAACPTDGVGWVAMLRRTPTPSGGQLPGDLWEEYRFECDTRLRLHLPGVGLAEFRAMRDWTDCIEEHEDDDHRITESLDTPPYGRIGER